MLRIVLVILSLGLVLRAEDAVESSSSAAPTTTVVPTATESAVSEETETPAVAAASPSTSMVVSSVVAAPSTEAAAGGAGSITVLDSGDMLSNYRAAYTVLQPTREGCWRCAFLPEGIRWRSVEAPPPSSWLFLEDGSFNPDYNSPLSLDETLWEARFDIAQGEDENRWSAKQTVALFKQLIEYLKVISESGEFRFNFHMPTFTRVAVLFNKYCGELIGLYDLLERHPKKSHEPYCRILRTKSEIFNEDMTLNFHYSLDWVSMFFYFASFRISTTPEKEAAIEARQEGAMINMRIDGAL